MNSEHPDIEQLQTYLQDNDASDQAAVRMHLLACQSCRQQVDALGALAEHHASIVDCDTLSDEQHQLIMDHIDGRLDAAASTAARQMIDQQPAAMRAALHYAGHSHNMAQQAETDSPTSGIANTSAREAGLLQRLLSMLDYRTPLWASIPATAFTVAALAFITIQYSPALLQDDMQIALYQDDAVIQFRSNDALPGIGFFSQAGRSNQAYTNVDVKITDSTDTMLEVAISWPAVALATRYDMKLQSFSAGEKVVLDTITTTDNSTRFRLQQHDAERRYEWILSGETSDNRTFYTTGGFVIHTPDG